MLNVHDLERRWLRYKIKSYAPIALGSLAFVITTVIAISFIGNSETAEPEEIVVQTPIKKVSSTPIEILPVQTIIEVPQNTQEDYRGDNPSITQKDTSRLVLKPSLHFMDNIEDGLNPYLEDELPIDDSSTDIMVQANPSSPTQQRVVAKKKKKGGLVLSTKKSEKDLKDVIRRFKKNKNPALSLFIAKRYYELKKYQRSYNYALMTNEIDKEIDESWIIFAKSLVKLKQKELAILTLKSYLKTKKSTQAEILLRKIQAGTFK